MSLASALALPLTTDSGAPFPQRDLLIFLTFAVIFATLVLQGLTLPLLIRLLGVEDDGAEEREEVAARRGGARGDRPPRRTGRRGLDARRHRRAHARPVRLPPEALRRPRGRGAGRRLRGAPVTYQRIVHEVIDAQRDELVRLRNQGEISDDVRRRVERDLDLEESRLEL